ncbi:MAG: hypothetical protein KJO75_04560 [Dactylosporangium sp.]|nr:hypothetical protein [Dactylosporangium sp.]
MRSRPARKRCPLTLPAHVARFGPQVKAKGVDPDAKDVDRTIGYITKYVTKVAAGCHTITSQAQRDHLNRLWQALCITPCSERRANWLLYGIQPRGAQRSLRPGFCKGKVHQQATLGIGGRRILVSRNWSGKSLADHRYDAKAWVRALLGVGTDAASAEPAPVHPTPPTPPAGLPRSPGNWPAPTIPTWRPWATGSCGPSPNASSGGPNATPPGNTSPPGRRRNRPTPGRRRRRTPIRQPTPPPPSERRTPGDPPGHFTSSGRLRTGRPRLGPGRPRRTASTSPSGV